MSLVQATFDELQKKNPDLKESDVNMLSEWCEKQPHLPKLSKSEITLFLHSNYYRLEPTKSTMDNYFTVRTHVTEFFANRDPVACKELRKIFKTVSTVVLKGTTREGYKIIYGSLIDNDPSNYVYNDGIKFFNMVVDLWLYLENTMEGHIILFDVKNVSFGHAGRLSPMGLKKYLYYLQEGLPVRLKGLHFMNTSPVMDMILNMMKPFIKKDLMSVLQMHSTTKSLEEFIPVEVLPNECGGKAGPIMDLQEAQIKQLEDYREWFREIEQTKCVDESLRPGKGKSATDLFGIEGSFKKLDID